MRRVEGAFKGILIEKQTEPGIDPDNTSFHVVHSESIRPATAARFPVDGASAFSTHGCGFNPGQAGIPVCPKQNTANRKKKKKNSVRRDIRRRVRNHIQFQ